MYRSDEELMIDYQSGNSEAIQTLFERYKVRLLNFCLTLLKNRADAEEMTSEVFLALYVNKNAFTGQAKFSTWAYTIARNKCVSALRRRRNVFSLWFFDEETESQSALDVADPKDIPSQKLAKEEMAAYLRQAILKLPQEQREAISLREFHDLSYEQISEVLDCSLEKVKILIFRAKEQLRIKLAPFIKEGKI